MSPVVTRTAFIPAGPAVVWDALVADGALSAWFGDDARLDPVPGGQLQVVEDGRLRRAVVVNIEPGRHLAFRWLPHPLVAGFGAGPADDTPAGASGEVEITLSEVPGGTLVEVTERAPAVLPAASGVLCPPPSRSLNTRSRRRPGRPGPAALLGLSAR